MRAATVSSKLVSVKSLRHELLAKTVWATSKGAGPFIDLSVLLEALYTATTTYVKSRNQYPSVRDEKHRQDDSRNSRALHAS